MFEDYMEDSFSDINKVCYLNDSLKDSEAATMLQHCADVLTTRLLEAAAGDLNIESHILYAHSPVLAPQLSISSQSIRGTQSPRYREHHLSFHVP